MILRLEPLANGDCNAANCIDVVAGGLQDSAYVGIWQSERRYRGTLGLRDGDGMLIALATSNEIALPPAGPAAEEPNLLAPGSGRCDPFLPLFEREDFSPSSSFVLLI